MGLAGFGLTLTGFGLASLLARFGMPSLRMPGFGMSGLGLSGFRMPSFRLSSLGGFAAQCLFGLCQGVLSLLLLAGGRVGLAGGFVLARLLGCGLRLLQILLGGFGAMGQFLIAVFRSLMLQLLRGSVGLLDLLSQGSSLRRRPAGAGSALLP